MVAVMVDDRQQVKSQRDLFLANRTPLGPRAYESLFSIESLWMEGLLTPLTAEPKSVPSFEGYKSLLNQLIQKEAGDPSPSAAFLAQTMDRKQFRALVEQFAVDGLTEAQAFPAIIPRLPMRAQMPIQRILIDEFGCGNLDQMHTNLYCQLLQELGSHVDLDYFVPTALDSVLEFVNIFHWMTKRSPDIEYFLGALSWFEGVVPAFFGPYVQACDRLGISAHRYYSEHIHIDKFHAQSALLAIRETAKSQPVDYTKVWMGSQLVQIVADRAFDDAVELAKKPQIAA